MKRIFIVLCIVLGYTYSGFSQNKLYVLKDETVYWDEIDYYNENADRERWGELMYGKGYAYNQGKYNISENTVDLRVGYRFGYNDDVSDGCSGVCGVFAWFCNERITRSLSPMQEFRNIDIPDVCLYVKYQAIFLPKLDIENPSPCPEEGKLFKKYNNQVASKPNIAWEYRDLDNRWKPITNHRNRFPLNYTAKEILGAKADDFVNRTLFLRYKVSATFTSDVLYSDPYSFDVKACSPGWVSTSPTNTSCYGANDGSARLTFDNDIASGYQMRYFIYQGNPGDFTGDPESGTLPQAYTDHLLPSLTNNGNDTYSGATQRNLEPGNYYIVYQEVRFSGTSVTVKSGEITPRFTIDGRSQIVTGITNTIQPECVGAKGIVTLSSTGGTNFGAGVLEYSIAGSGDWQSSNVFDQLDQGVGYRFLSRRRFGSTICEGTTTGLVTINEITNSLGIFAPGTSVTKPAYNPTSASGALIVSTSNGTGPYTYILKESGTNTEVSRKENISTDSTTFIDLLPDDYIVEVTDAIGCSVDTDVLTVSSLPVPQLGTPIVTEILCINDANGKIEIEVTNGASYRWYKVGEAAPIQTGNIDPMATVTVSAEGLSWGEYRLEVIPAGGDFSIPETVISSAVIPLANPAEVVISNPVATDMICYGDANGKITLDLNGGTSYEYQLAGTTTWTPMIGNEIPIVTGGFYDITVRNQNECLSNTLTDIFVYEPDEIELFIDIKDEVTSFGGNDGAISVTIQGGTPPYSYEWSADNGFVSFSEDITTLEAGEYMLVVSDANSTTGSINGCVLVTNFTITQPDIIEETITDPTCFEGCDGSISLLVNQGIGTFTYSWDNGMTGSNITGLCAGFYTVTIDGLPNGTQQRTYEVVNPDELIIPLPDTKTFCVNQEPVLDATITGQGPITYLWSSDNGFSSSTALVTLPNTAATYTVVATDQKGCVATHSITVVLSEAEIDAEFGVSSQVFTGDDVILIDLSYPLPDSIEWILPKEANIEKQDQDEVILTFDKAGEYEVGLLTKLGDCEEIQMKTVLVIDQQTSVGPESQEEDSAKKIEDFLPYPNPSRGKFTVDITLGDIGKVDIKVFSLISNRMMAQQQQDRQSEYSIPFDLSGLSTGVYAIVLETPYGRALRKIVVE
ncbi:T9SS type A sorting domain-containing protein [Aquimarina mytili]|uniref:T9SS type A sorting domain-containing protein n=1 Tax=Aquimarina mytili TaxID=874423 RepID=A0A936ZZK0_9FLAO|nr:T9SS type A sorting domain-containing protein [Aquimarina mytili]MBL0685266.1 T9SS type A sorting domain-containing protein [Aquimarina mytili]